MANKLWICDESSEIITLFQPKDAIDVQNCAEISDNRGSYTIMLQKIHGKSYSILRFCRVLTELDRSTNIDDYLPLIESACRFCSEIPFGACLKIYKKDLPITINVISLLEILNQYNK